MGETKRQHYVPVSYLKRFSFDEKRLYTFLISNSCCEPKGVTDVCVSKKYYTLSPETVKLGYDPLMLEKKYFQNYAEPRLSQAIRTIENAVLDFQKHKVTSAYIDIPYETRLLLIEATFIQYYRSPRQRIVFENIGNAISCVCEQIKNHRGLLSNDIPNPDVPYIHAEKTFLNPYLLSAFVDKLLR